ncbi:MAG: ATP-binding protein [Bacteroidales bacterium]|nr:ATP-binding protein [Candidatus Scybalocola fimicaballi]
MIKRELYLQKIKPFINKPIIKVLTGIRRSGKSELMKMVRDELLSQGEPENNIIYLNFESLRWADLSNSMALYGYICEHIATNSKTYIFLDEIQEVENWEKVVNSLMADYDVDIYITGSNSRMLSSELSTYLTGRYIEISVFTLSLSEFMTFHSIDTDVAFPRYLKEGGFPSAHNAEHSEDEIYKIVSDIYASALLRDTIQRHNIRNIDVLERLVGFLMMNLGNVFSAKNISAYLKSQQRKIDVETIYNYIRALESSYIIHRVSRYDLKGKEVLQTNEKLYFADLSLLYSRYGYMPDMIAGYLENLVYLHLLRKGYKVYVGKSGSLEIDFVAFNGNETMYVQVTYTMESEETRNRELRPLQHIKDNHPKYVVVADKLQCGNINGIQCVWIGDFLKE